VIEAATAVPTPVATITPVDTIVGVIITPTFVFDPDANMLQNGEFADDWVNGWARTTTGTTGIVEVRPVDGEPGTTMAHLEHSGPGREQLGQRVVLTTPIEGLTFRGRIRQSGGRGATGEGRSALLLRYEDAAGAPLGASIWLDGSAEGSDLLGVDPLPAPGPAVAVHTAGEGWQALEVSLSDELRDQLPDLDPVLVRQITVLLAVIGGEGCGPTDCATSLDAIGLSLSAGG
jgi:hypothetical protein